MNIPLMILAAVATLGAVDVLYFHLYRFRLYAQPGSVAEEVTHLIRHVIFLLAIALLASGVQSDAVDRAVIALFFLDLINSAADILLERQSRAPLGGLPSLEYLVHVTSSVGIGMAAASYVFLRPQFPLPPPEGFLAFQVGAMLVTGVILFFIEAGLFSRAIARRAGRSVVAAGA